MANVCVITGGGSGMGLAAARFIDKDVILVLTGRTVAKLENAKAALEAEGHEVHPFACDVSSRRDVHELCLFAADLGTIRTVIHSAGLSPAMADPEQIIRVNAVGTKNVLYTSCLYRSALLMVLAFRMQISSAKKILA